MGNEEKECGESEYYEFHTLSIHYICFIYALSMAVVSDGIVKDFFATEAQRHRENTAGR